MNTALALSIMLEIVGHVTEHLNASLVGAASTYMIDGAFESPFVIANVWAVNGAATDTNFDVKIDTTDWSHLLTGLVGGESFSGGGRTTVFDVGGGQFADTHTDVFGPGGISRALNDISQVVAERRKGADAVQRGGAQIMIGEDNRLENKSAVFAIAGEKRGQVDAELALSGVIIPGLLQCRISGRSSQFQGTCQTQTGAAD